MTNNINVYSLPICTSCKNTGRKSVKRKTTSINVIDYIVCPDCKNYEAFYKTTEKMKDKKDGDVIYLDELK